MDMKEGNRGRGAGRQRERACLGQMWKFCGSFFASGESISSLSTVIKRHGQDIEERREAGSYGKQHHNVVV